MFTAVPIPYTLMANSGNIQAYDPSLVNETGKRFFMKLIICLFHLLLITNFIWPIRNQEEIKKTRWQHHVCILYQMQDLNLMDAKFKCFGHKVIKCQIFHPWSYVATLQWNVNCKLNCNDAWVVYNHSWEIQTWCRHFLPYLLTFWWGVLFILFALQFWAVAISN